MTRYHLRGIVAASKKNGENILGKQTVKRLARRESIVRYIVKKAEIPASARVAKQEIWDRCSYKDLVKIARAGKETLQDILRSV